MKRPTEAFKKGKLFIETSVNGNILELVRKYDLGLTEKDFKDGERIIKEEREKVTPLEWETTYGDMVYWILSIRENHRKQTLVYNQLRRAGFLNPEKISNLSSREEVDYRRILKITRDPNRKNTFIGNAANFWMDELSARTIDRTIADSLNGRESGRELRVEYVNGITGVAEKVASCYLISCGYDDIAAIDRHVLRDLNKLGCKVGDVSPNSRGPDTKAYLEGEEVLRALSKVYGVKLPVLQAGLWNKRARGNVCGQTYLEVTSYDNFPVP